MSEANLCGEHGSRYDRPEHCAACDVVADLLEERGVVPGYSLLTGYGYHKQEWAFRDLEEVALDISNGTDEPSFTWILKIAGRWAGGARVARLHRLGLPERIAAGATHFYRGNDQQHAVVGFELNKRRIQFALLIPTEADLPKKRSSNPENLIAKLTRAKWRALYLTIKAKLVSVESKIEVFEEAFLGQILVPHDGRAERFATLAIKSIAEAYTGGKMPPLLPSGR